MVDEDGLHVTPGRGRFIPTPPNSLFVYGRVNARDQVSSDVTSQQIKTWERMLLIYSEPMLICTGSKIGNIITLLFAMELGIHDQFRRDQNIFCLEEVSFVLFLKHYHQV